MLLKRRSRYGRKRAAKASSARPVIGKRVTDFLDLNEVILAAKSNWIQDADGQASEKSVLVADASAFSRGMVRSGLDMAGYVVYEASNLEEAKRRLERQPVDVCCGGAGSSIRGLCRFACLHAQQTGVGEYPGSGAGQNSQAGEVQSGSNGGL